MSNAIPERPASSNLQPNLTIVASRYNERYTDALVENCVSELQQILPCATVDIVRVPGAFEIPVTIKAIAQSSQPPTVIIALGVIIQGSTEHASLVGTSVTQALLDLAVATGIPIIHEVLLLNDTQQAEERCIGQTLNRGRESARAAAAMAQLFMDRFLPHHQ